MPSALFAPTRSQMPITATPPTVTPIGTRTSSRTRTAPSPGGTKRALGEPRVVAGVAHQQEHRDRAQRPVRGELVGDRRDDAERAFRADQDPDADHRHAAERDADRHADEQQDDDRAKPE